jgi:hypothetical protein
MPTKQIYVTITTENQLESLTRTQHKNVSELLRELIAKAYIEAQALEGVEDISELPHPPGGQIVPIITIRGDNG